MFNIFIRECYVISTALKIIKYKQYKKAFTYKDFRMYYGKKRYCKMEGKLDL